jgi:hypothetical protein
VTTAAEAILRYFREPPPRAPEDLGIVFTVAGAERFAAARDVVEITPPLAVALLPGSADGVAFWRGRAYEVRGDASRAASFLLLSGSPSPFFVASDSRPRAASRAAVSGVPDFREDHVGR